MQEPDAQQATLVGDQLGVAAGRLDGVEDAGRIGPEGETVGVQLEPLAVSREQRHADLVFEAGQRARHVRLVDAQLRSGVARVLRLGQRQEDAEGLLVHDTDYAPIASQAASVSFPAHP